MTKAHEHGENEITRDLIRWRQAGEDVCAILRAMRQDAVRRGDKALERKIIAAEKYFGCRNKRKRRKS